MESPWQMQMQPLEIYCLFKMEVLDADGGGTPKTARQLNTLSLSLFHKISTSHILQGQNTI